MKNRKMTKDQYRAARLRLGLTQVEVARLMGVHEITICRRESGILLIDSEASAAMHNLVEMVRAGKLIGVTKQGIA